VAVDVATQEDVRRIAGAMPGTIEAEDRFAFAVEFPGKKERGFAWVWFERVQPKKARVANPSVLALRVVDTTEKELLLASNPTAIFTEPHYNGFPAVLIRLDVVALDELAELIVEAWRCVAPKTLVFQFDGQRDE
jgi:hypothetical protein